MWYGDDEICANCQYCILDSMGYYYCDLIDDYIDPGDESCDEFVYD